MADVNSPITVTWVEKQFKRNKVPGKGWVAFLDNGAGVFQSAKTGKVKWTQDHPGENFPPPGAPDWDVYFRFMQDIQRKDAKAVYDQIASAKTVGELYDILLPYLKGG